MRGGRNKNQKRTMWTGVCSFLSHVPPALDGAYHPLQACCAGLEKFEFLFRPNEARSKNLALFLLHQATRSVATPCGIILVPRRLPNANLKRARMIQHRQL